MYAETVSQRLRVSLSSVRPSFSRSRERNEPPFSSGGCWGNIQDERTGTSELDNKYEAPIANPTASESGTNRDRETPDMKNEGTNTAQMHNIARMRGICTSLLACRTATGLPVPCPRWL